MNRGLNIVATVLTACGIETLFRRQFGLGVQLPVATVLTACGIETGKKLPAPYLKFSIVATVLTACGIETFKDTMTKLTDIQLQQCLPLAVLKLASANVLWIVLSTPVATVLTACGIETYIHYLLRILHKCRCNSAYRLRY